MAQQPYLLSEKDDLSVIFSPLKKTQRIKYTCFNVSEKFLVLGATSGGLYVFRRDPISFLQLLPNKEGPVMDVNISPNEKLFAFSTVKGTVCILERNSGPGARVVQISRKHVNSEVTAMQWNTHSNELYIGDNLGRVSVVNILMFMATNMFNMPTFMLMHLDSKIVQFDWQGSLLLVSTFTRCYLCNTYNEEYRQIGQKLREGEFGACFFNLGDETVPCGIVKREKVGSFSSLAQDVALSGYECYNNVKIFCARPGSRLWEVEIDGLRVKNTHQFKEALAVEPANIVHLNLQPSSQGNLLSQSLTFKSDELTYNQQSFNFAKLCILSKKFLFTFKSDGIYIFDPVTGSVVLWNNDFHDIVDCRIFNDTVYIRLVTGAMHTLTFSSLEKFLFCMYLQKNYMLCGDLCVKYLEYLRSQVGLSHRLLILSDLGDHITNNDVAKQISPFLLELSKYKGIQTSLQLKSGIFLVHNSHLPTYLDNVYDVTVGQTRRDLVNSKKRLKRSQSLSCTQQNNENIVFDLRKYRSCSSIPGILKPTQMNGNRLHDSEYCYGTNKNKSLDPDLYNGSELPLPFSALASPEAIQALKQIGHSVTDKIANSTKSLKEKWHSWDYKMRHIRKEHSLEPFDIKLVDSEIAPFTSDANQSSQLENDSSLIFVDGSRPHPILEVSHITQLCIQLEASKIKGDDVSETIIYELFFNLSSMYNKFVLPRPKEDTGKTVVPFDFASRQFPLRHYFTDATINVIQETLHESLKSKVLIDWIEQLSTDVDLPSINIPVYLTTVHSRRSLETDRVLSNILKVLIEFIDPNTIIECVKTSQVPCYYLSLSAILDCYEEGAFNYLNQSRADSEKLPLLSLLSAMFWLLRMGQVETCLKMGESVHIKDVLYLILRLESHLTESGIKPNHAILECYTQFLTYIDGTVPTTVTSALEDPEIRSFIFTGFQCLNSVCKQACLCGFPLLSYPPVLPRFPHLAELISDNLTRCNYDKLLELATKIPGMWYFVLKHRRHEDAAQLLPLIIHVGDIAELGRRLTFSDVGLWEEALSLFVKYQSGRCLNCGQYALKTSHITRISWTDLALMAIKSLGSTTAIDLLARHSSEIPPGTLKSRFFHGCLLTSMVDNLAAGLRGDVIDLVNSPFEGQPQRVTPTPNLGISILEAIKKDLAHSQSSNVQDSDMRSSLENIIETSCGEDMYARDTWPSLPETPQAKCASDPATHWGLAIDLETDNCPCCTLPLVSRGVMRNHGITAFRCGHAYHTACVKQGLRVECLLCKSYVGAFAFQAQ